MSTRAKFSALFVPLALLCASSLLWTACQEALSRTADPAALPVTAQESSVTTQEGFRVEHLYSPGEHEQGSWVALTTDDQGRLIASDQYGGLYRITPPAIGEDPSGTQVEALDVEIGHANGLLWAFNSLYVVVNSDEGMGGHASGFYRVTDEDGDGELDTVHTLKTFEGAGEHGPHAVRLGPDGSSLYLIAGNHTDTPDGFTSLQPPVWEEDGLFPAILDPRGHANDRMAPGGWIARTDSMGQAWELISTGFRNSYDMDFNSLGDLFVFDSDMEWDLGSPWYRPIRVVHATSGSEFGWRTGSGKFAPYYPDNLPPIVNIGQGSPTGVLMGYGAAFPARFQKGLFYFDWSFGTMYFTELEPDGATYSGEVEEFLSGVPLPLTDGVIGPDGALYFATGGRRLDSHLYRVLYEGDESTDPADLEVEETPERALRVQLEAFHGKEDPAAVSTAWPHLSHPDRFVRYAARIAVENQPVDSWQDRALSEEDPVALIQAIVALSRHADAGLQSQALDALAGLDYEDLDNPQQLDLLRAYQLVFIRMGEPDEDGRQQAIDELNPHYPADSEGENRELARLLSYLEAPEVVEKTLALLEQESTGTQDITYLSEAMTERSEQYGPTIAEMLENMPALQEITYVESLSHVEDGWTPEQRQTYFQWYHDALGRSGGASYKGFLEHMRSTALGHVPPGELDALAGLTGVASTQGTSLADLPQPEGPGRAWTQRELRDVMESALEEPRNFENGQRMYQATFCESCHAMGGTGSNIGPDLTQVGTRFSGRDLVSAIVSPSDVISDQYASTILTKTDGTKVIGRIVEETDDHVLINQNPYDPTQQVAVDHADIQNREPSPVSIMPPGLINRLNEEEVADLMAYLLAGGNQEHELFQQQGE